MVQILCTGNFLPSLPRSQQLALLGLFSNGSDCATDRAKRVAVGLTSSRPEAAAIGATEARSTPDRPSPIHGDRYSAEAGLKA
jgi:hypothetical protein